MKEVDFPDSSQKKESECIGSGELLRLGIAAEGEDIEDVFSRVAIALGEIEDRYKGMSSEEFREELVSLMQQRKMIPSTTILMNAGRNKEASLSACTVPPVDLRGDLAEVKRVVDQAHLNGMGTGFNFDDVRDPVSVIRYLNDVGVEGQKDKNQLRPVGNMGTISIHHPRLLDFINAKNEHLDQSWVFNFSVLMSDEDIERILRGDSIVLRDGTEIPSEDVLDVIAQSISTSGEPGLVFLERLNRDNQVPSLGEYKSLAPCGEIGLVEGEVCQFSYVNLGKFVDGGVVNYPALERTVRMAVRVLDDAVDYNIDRFESAVNKQASRQKRKIGVGVCGFADMLKALDLQYASPEARELAENVFSFINYVSKKESLELAKQRGPFESFAESKYVTGGDLISAYSKRETGSVAGEMWGELIRDVQKWGLRNCATIAIPPTGRSSYIIGASPSIEPFFREILNVSPEEQLRMVESIQRFTDESISKTVNIPETSSVSDIKEILRMAMRMDIKGITIYRDKSRELQPQKI